MGSYFNYNPTQAQAATVIAGLVTSPSERLIGVMLESGRAYSAAAMHNADMTMRAAELEANMTIEAAEFQVEAGQQADKMKFERERMDIAKKNAEEQLKIAQGELDLKKKEFDVKYGDPTALNKNDSATMGGAKAKPDASPETSVKVDAALGVTAVADSLRSTNAALNKLFEIPELPTSRGFDPTDSRRPSWGVASAFSLQEKYTPPARDADVKWYTR